MDIHLLVVALMLAYGPLAAALALYGAALVLRLTGRPWLLHQLIERTKTPQAIHRPQVDGIL